MGNAIQMDAHRRNLNKLYTFALITITISLNSITASGPN